MQVETEEFFPLSKKKTAKGSRRLVREKVLQILMAYEVCELGIDTLFEHIFFRHFNFDESKEVTVTNKILTQNEVYEIDADTPIIWKTVDLTFGRNLLSLVIEHRQSNTELLVKFADNWEVIRMAAIDKYLMMIAITELLYFPDIPAKVSINEAIDISKCYSTDKSSIFINGILDKFLTHLKKTNTYNKVGRGLKEGK